MNVIGVMSGSSLDGLDFSLVRFGLADNKDSYSFIVSETIAYPKDIIKILYKIRTASLPEFFVLKQKYSVYLGEAIKAFILKNNLEVDVIASHGHTVFHFPKEGFSTQIGDGAIISTCTGIDTICDFRSQDIALGGQGAPLAPTVEKGLFPQNRLFLNLGGIANISFFRDDTTVSAFDICGCNQVLNHFANRQGKEYDDGGNLAKAGSLDIGLLTFLEKHPYYDLPYPKSLDNQYVYNEFIYPIPDVIPDQDVLHTYCNFIAKQIFNACKKLGVNDEEVFITGGGALNNFLISRIQNYLTPLNISLKIPSDDVVNFKESLLMAYMGYLFLQDRPNVLAESTGAKEGWVSGSLYKGKR